MLFLFIHKVFDLYFWWERDRLEWFWLWELRSRFIHTDIEQGSACILTYWSFLLVIRVYNFIDWFCFELVDDGLELGKDWVWLFNDFLDDFKLVVNMERVVSRRAGRSGSLLNHRFLDVELMEFFDFKAVFFRDFHVWVATSWFLWDIQRWIRVLKMRESLTRTWVLSR